MKKALSLSLAAILTVSVFSGCGTKTNTAQPGGSAAPAATSSAPATLTISGFGLNEDKMREYILKPFEEQNNCKIVLESGNNAERLAKVTNNPNSTIDIIYLSQQFAQQGFDKGAFEKIDYSKVSNAAKINEKAKFLVDQGQGPAYTMNRMGIIVKEGVNVKSFSDLWKSDFKGKIAIPDISTTFGPAMVVAASQKAGADYKADKGEAAFKALADLKPNVVKTYTKSSDLKNMFGSGEITAAVAAEFAYNSLGKDIKATFVDPTEGPYLNFNTLNIPKTSKNKDLALKYINYMLSEDVQLKSAQYLSDAPINTNVKLPDELAKTLTTNANVAKANALDFKIVNENLNNWVDKWNRTLNQ